MESIKVPIGKGSKLRTLEKDISKLMKKRKA